MLPALLSFWSLLWALPLLAVVALLLAWRKRIGQPPQRPIAPNGERMLGTMERWYAAQRMSRAPSFAILMEGEVPSPARCACCSVAVHTLLTFFFVHKRASAVQHVLRSLLARHRSLSATINCEIEPEEWVRLSHESLERWVEVCSAVYGATVSIA